MRKSLAAQTKRSRTVIAVLAPAVVCMALLCLFIGSSNMSLSDGIAALFGRGTAANVRIVRSIRLPRMLAAVIAGAALSVSGLIMQTTLANSMASPSTMGVSNAAVFGANLSIIVFAGGYLSTGNNLSGYMAGVDPFAASATAFVFAALSILLILALCRVRSFSPNVVVLAGIAVGSVWTAATTLLQFYATDVGLSAAVVWNFGDLGRATYKTDLLMFIVAAAGIAAFSALAWRYNTLLSGDAAAGSMGVNVSRLRFFSLLLASLMTAACVSSLGIIGFVGVICPHVVKRLIGQDHRFSVPASALMGSFLLLTADAVSRSLGSGSALPVGAITSLLGAPFFLGIIFTRKEHGGC